MKLSERIEKFIWKLRAMWTAADIVFEANRNVLGMTIELAREVEKRIKLKKELRVLRESYDTLAGFSISSVFDAKGTYTKDKSDEWRGRLAQANDSLIGGGK